MELPKSIQFKGSTKLVCPYCKHPSEITFLHAMQHGLPYTRAGGKSLPIQPYVVAALARCRTCDHPIMLRAQTPHPDGNIPVSTIDVFPPAIESADADIPDKIRNVFQEAMNCAGIKAWNAVGTMCRRAIQEAVLDNQGQGRDLFNQIEDLKTKGLLAGPLVTFAHRVRVIGRDGAHADAGFIDLDQTDAEDVIEFCKDFFDALYVTPKRLARQEAKRPK